MYVLLVEPDNILAKSFTAAFVAKGIVVQRVLTAHAAIQAANETMPDVVVLTMELPRHNGIEFLYEFRSYVEWRTVPVLLLVSQLDLGRLDVNTLTTQLGVHAILVKSQLTLARLCDAVVGAGGKA